MMVNDIRRIPIQPLSVPHREELIAKIKCYYYVIAEISQDHGLLEIESFSYNEHSILLPLGEYIKTLENVRKVLFDKSLYLLR